MNKTQRVEKYAYIGYEKRVKIIEFIHEKGYTIQRTANILGIKSSTARMILKKYRESGQIFMRKKEKRGEKLKECMTPTQEEEKTEKDSFIPDVEIEWFCFFPIVEPGLWPQMYYGNCGTFHI